jgi:hypothetical protein
LYISISDGDVADAGGDEVGGEVQCLLRRPALTINGGRRHFDGESREQHRLPSDVDGLLTGLRDATEDDVLDQRRVEPRTAGDLAKHVRTEVDRVNILEVTVLLVPPTQRGTNGLNDHDISHRPVSKLGAAIRGYQPGWKSRSLVLIGSANGRAQLFGTASRRPGQRR